MNGFPSLPEGEHHFIEAPPYIIVEISAPESRQPQRSGPESVIPEIIARGISLLTYRLLPESGDSFFLTG
jgi:hypothetical protein